LPHHPPYRRVAGSESVLKLVFWALFTLIGAVAAYDVYLSIKMRDVLHIVEENPLGRWLIALDGGDVALFMTIKMAGILVVLVSLQTLFRHHRRAGMTVVVALASFQIWLFGYLTFSDPCDPEVIEAREKWLHSSYFDGDPHPALYRR
jgi:hypothetical protein